MKIPMQFKLSLKEKAFIGIVATLIPILVTFVLIYSKNRVYLKNRVLDTLAVIAEAQQIAHIGNWEWDIVGNELYWSDEIYRIFDLLPQEFGATYEAFLNCVHPDDREFVKKTVNEALNDKKSYNIDHRILLKDTTIRIVHEKAMVVSDNKGRVVQMAGTVQDITERKRAEEEVVLLKTLILSISESKDLHDALVVALEKVCSATGWIYV